MSLSRRDFLKASGAAIAAPFAVTGLAQDRPKIVGQHMSHYYEVHHDWLKPPAGLLWGDTHGLTRDSKGRIYVAHTVHATSSKPESIVVYSPDGEFLNAWGAEFRGGAHGVEYRKEGGQEFLYHCDVNRRLVVKTDLEGRKVWELSAPKEAGVYSDSAKWNPTNVAFHPNGDLFVGDGYGQSYIHRFTKDGEYLSLISRPGKEAGTVSCPHGLWVDTRGKTPRLAVSDRNNRRIQYLTLDGKHISFITTGVRLPCNNRTKENLMLVPDLDSVVTLFDENDKVIASLGDGAPTNLRGKPRDQYVPGKFIHPHDAIFVNDRDLLVAEWVPDGRITLLRKL
jgi:TAT (twin-arginine translocation) pathway signal sequence